MVQILKVNATEAVGKLLVRVYKMQIMQHQPLADHILICMFWILSALATKGKTSFSLSSVTLYILKRYILRNIAKKYPIGLRF